MSHIFKGMILEQLGLAVFVMLVLCSNWSLDANPPHSSIRGRDYYVSSAGRDSNSGIRTSPFATFAKADSLVQPGDTVHVLAGDWQGFTQFNTITLTKSGTPSARIHWISHKLWSAHLVGHANHSGLGYTVLITGSYVDFEGFDVTGSGNIGIWVKGEHVRVIGNHVYGIPGPQPPVKDVPCSGFGAAGIGQGNHAGGYMEVIGNVVHDIGADGVGSCNKYQGIYLAAKYDSAFDNIVYRVSASGIHTWHAASNNSIVNNTVFGNNIGIFIGAGDDPCGFSCDNDHTVVEHNVLYKNRTYGFLQYKQAGPHNTYDSNLAFGNGRGAVLLGGPCSNGEETCNSFAHAIYDDPMFVNPTGDFFTGDYHFRPGSPAIQSAVKMGAVVEEREGRLIPQHQ